MTTTKKEVIAKGVTVYSKDKTKVYKNKQLYFVKYFVDGKLLKNITDLQVRLNGWWESVDYIGNGNYKLKH